MDDELKGFQDEAINDYCVANSTIPSKDCEALWNYTKENVPWSVMLSGKQVSALLGVLIRGLRAKRILEVGCFTGYSALAMAEHLPDDGELITLDINPETDAIAQRFWKNSKHGHKIRSIVGPAKETLNQLKGPFDFVFIDADKGGYIDYFERALELLAPKGIIACDNALFGGEVIQARPTEANAVAMKKFNDHVLARKGIIHTILPIRDGVHLISKA